MGENEEAVYTLLYLAFLAVAIPAVGALSCICGCAASFCFPHRRGWLASVSLIVMNSSLLAAIAFGWAFVSPNALRHVFGDLFLTHIAASVLAACAAGVLWFFRVKRARLSPTRIACALHGFLLVTALIHYVSLFGNSWSRADEVFAPFATDFDHAYALKQARSLFALIEAVPYLHVALDLALTYRLSRYSI